MKNSIVLVALSLLFAQLANLSICSAANPEIDALAQQVISLYQAGAYRKAIPIAEQILTYNERVLGPENPDTATALNDLGELYRAMGDYSKAEPLFERALLIREKEFGLEDAATALSLDNLALLYEQTGNYAKAEPLLHQALIAREKLFGPEHHTAVSLNNLAELYRQIGEYTKAEPLYERALTIEENVLGAEHRETAISINNLALLYRQMGNYAKAEPLYQRALTIEEKVLGPEHANTAASLNDLGQLYGMMGDYAKAAPLLQRALRIREKVLGPEHPDTAASLNNLGFLYNQLGDYRRAEALYQRALRIHEKVFGPEHFSTATSLNNLGQLYEMMGDYAKAELLSQRALRIHEKVFGPEHPSTALSLNNLGELYEMMGDYAKAKPLLQRTLAIDEKVLGPEHPDTATSLNNLGFLFHQMGDYPKAAALHQRALRIREKVLGPEHPNTALSLNNLGESYEMMGDYAKAEPLLQRALQINEKILGAEHPAMAVSFNNLAGLHEMMGDYAKAETLLQRTLAIDEKVLGPEHPETTTSLNNLALLELHVGNIPEARTLALRSQKTQIEVLSNILSFCSEQQRLAYQNTMLPYTLFAALDGSDSELASACLRYKGVVLDSVIEDRVLAEASQNKEEREMVQRLGVDKQRLGQMLLEVPKVPADQSTKQIQQLEQEVEQTESKLARNVAGSGRPRRALATTVEEVQAAIPADSALIEYLRYQGYLGTGKFEPRYGAIVLTRKGKPQWISIGRADEIEKSIMRYRNQVADRETAHTTLEETLRGLFDQVWTLVEKNLPDQTRRVIISPDGQLNFVSFATLLTTKDRFLAEDHLIQYVSSGRDLLRDRKLAPNSQLIAFGNPEFNLKPVADEKGKLPSAQQIAFRGKTREDLEELGLDALPGTKAECAVLAERAKQWKWPSTQFLAADATEAELRKLRSPHTLHLATHGFVLDAQREDHAEPGLTSSFEVRKLRYFENPMHRAGLALAGAQTTLDAWRRGETPPTENDGIVTAEDVGALNLEGTWLVTLSACNTGGGEAKSGEGVLGLRRGFIQAGVENLLMTLWPISDETTVDIMAEFYDAAHKSGNAPQALAQVQRDWLVKLRKTNGLLKAVNLAGPFILSSQGKP